MNTRKHKPSPQETKQSIKEKTQSKPSLRGTKQSQKKKTHISSLNTDYKQFTTAISVFFTIFKKLINSKPMPKQKGLIKFTGTLNGMCYYVLNGQYIVRKAAGPSKERSRSK